MKNEEPRNFGNTKMEPAHGSRGNKMPAGSGLGSKSWRQLTRPFPISESVSGRAQTFSFGSIASVSFSFHILNFHHSTPSREVYFHILATLVPLSQRKSFHIQPSTLLYLRGIASKTLPHPSHHVGCLSSGRQSPEQSSPL